MASSLRGLFSVPIELLPQIFVQGLGFSEEEGWYVLPHIFETSAESGKGMRQMMTHPPFDRLDTPVLRSNYVILVLFR